MLRRHAICSSFLLLILSLSAPAQKGVTKSDKNSAVTITAFASGERVRFTAPSSVVQIRLEIYNSTGTKLFDNEVRGNVLDWHLQDGQAEPLADDAYLCVVTVKSLSGKLTQRIGSVTVEKSSASVQPVEASQMTPQQSQAIGPVEENASWIVLKEDEKQTTMVIAHNGEEGQLTRGQGALSFRIGEFFSGKDREQMRLTEEGNLGIGITHPQARLDVDGLIRTSQGIVFADGTIQTTAAASASRGEVAPGDIGVGAGKLFNETNQGASSGKDGKGKKKVKPELFVNEDLTVNGNIIFTPSLARDITMQNNSGGIRIFGAPTLTGSPAAAAIQFFGTGHPGFPGQAFIDSGANDAAAVIIRTTGTGGTITERMRVTATGRVGIGTTSPTAPLALDNFTVTATATPQVSLVSTLDATSANVFGLDTEYTTAGSSTNNIRGFRVNLNAGYTGSGVTAAARFNNLAAGTHVFNSADETGNIGVSAAAQGVATGDNIGVYSQTDGGVVNIGVVGRSTNTGAETSSTIAHVGVLGNARRTLSSTSMIGGAFNLGDSTAGWRTSLANVSTALMLRVDKAALGSSYPLLLAKINDTEVFRITSTGGILSSPDADSTTLWQVQNNAGTTFFDLDSTNQRVGIGTASPAKKLDVRDGTGASSSGGHVQIGAPDANADEKIIVFGDSGCGVSLGPCVYIGEQDANDRMVLRAASFRFKTGDVLPEVDSSQALGSSANRWSAVFAVNGTIQTSDARLKQEIANLKYGLSQVMQLRPVSFLWKDGNDKRTHLGLIAQEVEAVLPEAVQKDIDAGAPLGMNYSSLIPVIIKAMQEQQITLNTLKAENAALNARLAGLEKRQIRPRLASPTSLTPHGVKHVVSTGNSTPTRSKAGSGLAAQN